MCGRNLLEASSTVSPQKSGIRMAVFAGMSTGSRIFWTTFLVGACVFLFLVFGAAWLADRPMSAPINSCINQLRQIDGATVQWAVEHHEGTNAEPTWGDIQPYLKFTPRCRAGGKYTLGTPSRPPTCSLPQHTLTGS
jgi:hypothetical protein